MQVFERSTVLVPGSGVLWPLVWAWLAVVAVIWAMWRQQQGDVVGFFALALSLPALLVALLNVARAVYRRFRPQPFEAATFALRIGPGDYAPTFFESQEREEIDAIRVEIERVFAQA